MHLLKRAGVFAMLCLAAISLPTLAAFALEVADGVVVAADPTFVQQLVNTTLPALGLLLTAIVGWEANELHKRTGLDIEARHREALQSALINGVKYGLQKAGWLPNTPIPPNLLGFATNYVSSSVPDALAHFRIDPASR